MDPRKGEPNGTNRDNRLVEGVKGGANRRGKRWQKWVCGAGLQGKRGILLNKVEGVKEEKRRYRWWSPVGGFNVQVDSRTKTRRERYSRVQKIGESQSNGGGRGIGRMQDMGGKKDDPGNI